MSNTLALDMRTGSCRAVIFTDAGEKATIGQREWTHTALPGGRGSQSFGMERNWRLVCECIREALEKAKLPSSAIAGVSSTGMREGMVLFDRAEHKIWACPNVDSRAGAEAAELARSGAAQRIYERGGDWVSITSP